MKVTCPIAPDFPIHPALPPPALPPPTATFQEMKDVRGHDSEGFHMVPDSRHVAHAPCSCDMRLPRPPQVLMTEREEDAQLHPSWEPVQNIYALGDCSADLDRPLPALAQAPSTLCRRRSGMSKEPPCSATWRLEKGSSRINRCSTPPGVE